MKSSSIFLTCLLLILTIGDLDAQQLSIGLETGWSSSLSSNFEFTSTRNRRNTFKAGVNLSYSLRPFLSLTTGFHYLPQGYKHPTCHSEQEGVTNQLITKLDYLSLPLIANLHLGSKKRLFFSGGIYGAYKIRAVRHHKERIGGCRISDFGINSKDVRDVSGGAIVGIGYRVIEMERVQVETKLQGWKSFGKIDPYQSSHSLQFTVGVNYRLNK
ncbi:MAG: porin family protein [Bacteroidota bacterium]